MQESEELVYIRWNMWLLFWGDKENAKHIRVLFANFLLSYQTGVVCFIFKPFDSMKNEMLIEKPFFSLEKS